jgi:hypothetical protein
MAKTMPTQKPTGQQLVPIEVIERRILLLRGHKVMLDRDLAALYEVKPIALRQAVKRNSNRFPADFVIQLSKKEAEALVLQNVIPSRRSLGGFFGQFGDWLRISARQHPLCLQKFWRGISLPVPELALSHGLLV